MSRAGGIGALPSHAARAGPADEPGPQPGRGEPPSRPAEARSPAGPCPAAARAPRRAAAGAGGCPAASRGEGDGPAKPAPAADVRVPPATARTGAPACPRGAGTAGAGGGSIPRAASRTSRGPTQPLRRARRRIADRRSPRHSQPAPARSAAPAQRAVASPSRRTDLPGAGVEGFRASRGGRTARQRHPSRSRSRPTPEITRREQAPAQHTSSTAAAARMPSGR